ncbi:MAG: ethanolamine ammonia-lyase subunit EutB [Alphaproteobacteria bacterium]|nr:ethanolamine ammonia-lyase subunit EutB [Alphaproteobacteria bacterium]
MAFKTILYQHNYTFEDLKTVLAKASPCRSGDLLAGVAAIDELERVAAQIVLADLPLTIFIQDPIIDPQKDEVSRLIIDAHQPSAFQKIKHLTIGGFRDFLLATNTDGAIIRSIADGIMPEMAAAVSKIMRNQDLILVSQKISNITQFRTSIGLPNSLATRLQPNHPTDNPQEILKIIVDGLLHGNGDAVVGINPASQNIKQHIILINMLERLRQKFTIPIQSCVLGHILDTKKMIQQQVPIDLIFQSIAGTEKANASFGISLGLLDEVYHMGLELKRNGNSRQIMYFETGQGSALSADGHHGIDQQTCEARAYSVAKKFKPFLVNSVVGFIGPEYLYDEKQIVRAALEDLFCGKLLGLNMGLDICYTNHTLMDQDDLDVLLTIIGVAGCSYIMGVPGSEDTMLQYQSTSFHDALYLRKVLGKVPAPEFANWLRQHHIFDDNNQYIIKPSTSKKLAQKLLT